MIAMAVLLNGELYHRLYKHWPNECVLIPVDEFSYSQKCCISGTYAF